MKAFFWKHVHINDESASLRWAVSLAVAIALYPVLGSVVNPVVIGMAVFALNYWFFADFRMMRTEKITAFVVSFYVLISAFLPLLHENPYNGFLFGLSNVGLLTLVLLMPVLRYCKVGMHREFLVLAFPAAGILMLIGLGFESFALGKISRAELLTGNSLILAFLSAISLLGCSVFGFTERKRRLIFFTLGFMSSLLVLAFTASRAPLVFGVGLSVLYIIIQAVLSRHRKTNMFLILLSIATCIGGVLLKEMPAVKYLTSRSISLIEQVQNFDQPELLDKSTQMRMAYYKIGLDLVSENSMIGIGRVNVMQVATEKAPQQIKNWFEKTHLHNGYLTELAGNGIVGLIGLLMVLVLPVFVAGSYHTPAGQFAVLFTMFFVLYGFTNVSFYHDLTVFPFVVYVLFVYVLKPSASENTNQHLISDNGVSASE